MAQVNENYLNLQGSYLFATIARKVTEYSAAHPEADIIRLGIGDVTLPLVPAVTEAMHKAVDEMGNADTFRGYGPEQGCDFLRQAIVDGDYKPLGVDIAIDEVFVSDGAKSDVGNIQELFSEDNIILRRCLRHHHLNQILYHIPLRQLSHEIPLHERDQKNNNHQQHHHPHHQHRRCSMKPFHSFLLIRFPFHPTQLRLWQL